jgi:hypothetical protein
MPADARPGTITVTDGVAHVATADVWLELEFVEVDGRAVPAAEVVEGATMFDRRA